MATAEQADEAGAGRCRSCLSLYRKPVVVNLLCLCFLLVYSMFGGFVFLHFEEPHWRLSRRMEFLERVRCVEQVLVSRPPPADRRRQTARLAARVVKDCVLEQSRDERMEWNLKNAVLFGFGILTTLGYGKIEPQTTEGRLFTVLYGFIGVPFTVIIFTNFGRYLQKLERLLRQRFWHCWRRRFGQQAGRRGSWVLPPITVMDEEEAAREAADEARGEEEQEDQISPLTLVCIVVFYLLLGASLIDWLDQHVDFPNGIYFAFLCLTAIEYGKLIPTEALYLPLVIAYICFGLAISTIALDIGSTYVKKLYYLGRKIRNIASIKIWFGAKHLRVRELLAALGHNIGLEPTVLCDLDLEQLISNAISVKEGRLHRVPQTHMIMDGIWPPELVPLFLKDGTFPDWIDAERRKWSAASFMAARRRSIRSALLSLGQKPSTGSDSNKSARLAVAAAQLASNQPPERSPPLPPLLPEKLSVRFEEFIRSPPPRKWSSLATTTSGVISDNELSAAEVSAPVSNWSLTIPADGQQHSSTSTAIRRSETVPPIGQPEVSLSQMCNFPSLEVRRRAPLPPLAPLPDEEEKEGRNDGNEADNEERME